MNAWAEELFEHNRCWAEAVARGLHIPHMSRPEILQAVLIGLWQAAQTYRGKTPFRTYAERRIVGVVLDEARREAKAASHTQCSPATCVVDDHGLTWVELEDLVQQVPGTHRLIHDVLRLSAYGLSSRSIAERLQCSSSWVIRLRHKAAGVLQNEL